MDLKDLFAFAIVVLGIGCFTAIAITWIKWRRPRVQDDDALTSRLEEISARLSRIENSVDATAVEVERISEAQRFTTKLLAGREKAQLPQ